MTSYVLAGYGVVLASLAAYAISLVIRLRSSRQRLGSGLSSSDVDEGGSGS
jgi:hypothetical protein